MTSRNSQVSSKLLHYKKCVPLVKTCFRICGRTNDTIKIYRQIVNTISGDIKNAKHDGTMVTKNINGQLFI